MWLGHGLEFIYLLFAQLLKRVPMKRYVHLDRGLHLPKGSVLPTYFCRSPLNYTAKISVSSSDLSHTY